MDAVTNETERVRQFSAELEQLLRNQGVSLVPVVRWPNGDQLSVSNLLQLLRIEALVGFDVRAEKP